MILPENKKAVFPEMARDDGPEIQLFLYISSRQG
jgi:hypothetical protein